MRKTASKSVVPVMITFILIVTPFTGLIAYFMVWLSSLPSWQISARNSPQGVVIEVYKSNAARPTFTTVLAGKTIDVEVKRVTRKDLPEKLAKTEFYDETLRPGRWTILLQQTELDIMEGGMTVDKGTDIAPQPQ